MKRDSVVREQREKHGGLGAGAGGGHLLSQRALQGQLSFPGRMGTDGAPCATSLRPPVCQ